MSGGSMDYLYRKVEYANFRTGTLERKAFAKHLSLVAKALHDIEWVDSGDFSEGDESAAIQACLSPSLLLETATEQAMSAKVDLEIALAKTKRETQ